MPAAASEDMLAAWADVGARIKTARDGIRPKLSIRAAAKRAFISESHWRTVERGYTDIHGTRVVPAVSPETLERILNIVRLAPADVFRRLNWTYEPALPKEQRPSIDQELEDVRETVTAALEALGQILPQLDAIEELVALADGAGGRAARDSR